MGYGNFMGMLLQNSMGMLSQNNMNMIFGNNMGMLFFGNYMFMLLLRGNLLFLIIN